MTKPLVRCSHSHFYVQMGLKPRVLLQGEKDTTSEMGNLASWVSSFYSPGPLMMTFAHELRKEKGVAEVEL